MKVKTINYGTEKDRGTIEQYVKRQLDGDDHDRGSLEAARKTADNAVECLGRLLNFLAENNKIKVEDLVRIVEGYDHYERVELIDS